MKVENCHRYYRLVMHYYRSGNIREVSNFANIARMTNSRIYESRENYYLVALIIIEIDNSRILHWQKISKLKKTQKSKYAKITRCKVLSYCKIHNI